MKPVISLVVPVLNEQENIPVFYQAVSSLIAQKGKDFEWEMVFTDNHSADKSFDILNTLASQDQRIRAVRFSKNVGYQKSILTGFRLAKGAAAIQMDCDLQDPPEMIFQFLEEWRGGAKVVYGIRSQRKEFFALEWIRKVFYRLIKWLSNGEIPLDAGDFRLLDRTIIDQLQNYRDESPYLRGFIARMGFDQVGIPYSRNERTRGESKFRMSALFSLALDGILSTSILPLRLATLVGLLVCLGAVVLSVGYTVAKVFFGASWPAGFTTIAILVLLSTGMNALFLGIIGEYLARLYRQAKYFEEVLIEKSIGLPNSHS